ncbi:MAG: hypothetical protein WCO52_02810 [bacterium]
MRERRILFVLIALGILSSAELFVILTTIAPSGADKQVLWLLFVCLFTSVSIGLSLVWHPVKQTIHRSERVSRLSSLRQTALISLVLTLVLLFRSLSIFSLWDIIPLAISAILIEFFFQADKTSLTPHESE